MHPQPRGSFNAADRAPLRSSGRRSAAESSLPEASYSVTSLPTSTAPRGLSGDFGQLISSANPLGPPFSPEIVGANLDNPQVEASYIRDYSAVRNSSDGTWGLFASNEMSRPSTQTLPSGPGQSSSEFNSSLPQSGLQGNIFRGEDVSTLESTFQPPFDRYSGPSTYNTTLEPSASDYELSRVTDGHFQRSASVLSSTSGSSVYGHELSSGMANVKLAHEEHDAARGARYRVRHPSRTRSRRDRSSSNPYYPHRDSKQDLRSEIGYSQATDVLGLAATMSPGSGGYVPTSFPTQLPFGLVYDRNQNEGFYHPPESSTPVIPTPGLENSGYRAPPYDAQTIDASRAYRSPRSSSMSDMSDQTTPGASTARESTSTSPIDGQVRVLVSQPKPQCWDHGCNGRTFSTFSNLLRHQREKSGTAAKSYCSKCGAEFTRSTAKKGHEALGKCKHRRNS